MKNHTFLKIKFHKEIEYDIDGRTRYHQLEYCLTQEHATLSCD